MLMKMLPFAKMGLRIRQYTFATTAERINYYKILGVDSGATSN